MAGDDKSGAWERIPEQWACSLIVAVTPPARALPRGCPGRDGPASQSRPSHASLNDSCGLVSLAMEDERKRRGLALRVINLIIPHLRLPGLQQLARHTHRVAEGEKFLVPLPR